MGHHPEGAVSIDAAGRVMVDGKPFLPVGIYATWLRKEDDLKRIADGGFNFILHYTSRGAFDIQSSDITTESDDRWTSPDYGSSRWNAVARRSLDLIHKYGLKYRRVTCGFTEKKILKSRSSILYFCIPPAGLLSCG